MKTRLVMTDAVAMHHRTGIPIPSAEDRRAVTAGSIVKVRFAYRGGPGERLWVKVTDVGPRTLRGTINNEPVLAGLAFGQPVEFERRHILDIYDSQEER